jgi:hypothetical protein
MTRDFERRKKLIKAEEFICETSSAERLKEKSMSEQCEFVSAARQALFPLACISKFTAIKTNLNVIYVTDSYLHKKFIYNLFLRMQLRFLRATRGERETTGEEMLARHSRASRSECDFYEY